MEESRKQSRHFSSDLNRTGQIMTHNLELLLLFVIQLFIIVDPLAAIPIFLAITPNNTKIERRMMARRASLAGFLVVVFFIVAGPSILLYFGIKPSAVRICGGVLLFLIAIELLYGRFTGTETSNREERLAEKKADVSITPLGIPLLAGPGAILTVLVFAGQAVSLLSVVVLVAGAAAVFGAAYLILFWADELARILGGLGMKIAMRIVGLLLALIAVEYLVDGVRDLFLIDRILP